MLRWQIKLEGKIIMTAKARKIMLEWPVAGHKHIANRQLAFLAGQFSWVRKFLLRFPQKIQDRLFFDKYTVTERIFEKGFCFMQIGKFAAQIKRIMDVGCCFSSLPIELASLGFKLWGIDVNDYFLKHPNFKFVKADVRLTPFGNDFFDLVTAISTIEHIGLGYYKEARADDGDYQALREIHRVLRPEGLFIITLPYGRNMATPLFRVYDDQRLSFLIQNFKVLDAKYSVNHQDVYWRLASQKEASNQGINARGRNTGNICLLLQK